MFKAYRSWLLAGVVIAASFAGGYATAYQGHMFNSLNLLRQAYDELAAAAPNKGGYRANGLQLIREAIQQVELGIDFARAHGDD